MSVAVRNALIGVGVGVLAILLLVLLGAGDHASLAGTLLGVFTWAILTNLSNNRAVRSVPAAERMAALATPPPPGCGLVYVYREGFLGRYVGYDVALDGMTVAQLQSPRFTRLVAPAGAHTLACGPKGFAAAQNKLGIVSFHLAPGETQVYGLKTKMGMMQNAIVPTLVANPQVIMQKFATMTMVAPETTAAAMPPPPPPNIPPR